MGDGLGTPGQQEDEPQERQPGHQQGDIPMSSGSLAGRPSAVSKALSCILNGPYKGPSLRSPSYVPLNQKAGQSLHPFSFDNP